MLLTRPVLDRIVAGEVDLVFRLWKRPTVKAGGRLRTAVGELTIHEVDVVAPDALDEESARRAGYADRASLLASVSPTRTPSARSRVARPDETSRVYRVRVSYAGADSRAALRDQLPNRAEVDALVARLQAMDARSPQAPWAIPSLKLISRWPGRRAPELAEMLGRETLPWKAQVRRLKELGLTESLHVGYRLSPRGRRVLAACRRRGL